MDSSQNEIFSDFENIVENTNKKLEANKPTIYSKEYLSILISECLVEDINTIKFLKNNRLNNRYVDSIIRNMTEQTIEYIYIMKNPELIPVYFGENLDPDINMINERNMFDDLNKTGSDRFSKDQGTGRKPVAYMASKIGEKKNTADTISLYTIFKNKAELEHNSYFHSILYNIDEVENLNTIIDEDLDYTFLNTIIAKFSDVYLSVDTSA